MTTPLKINIGERYLYHGETYEVVNIALDRVQLRTVKSDRYVLFQSIAKLEIALHKGKLRKIQEAPLSKDPEKILSGLSKKTHEKLNRRLTYLRPLLAMNQGTLPVEKTKAEIFKISKLIDDPKPPCYTTIHNWRTKYLLNGQEIISLIPKTHKRRLNRIYRYSEEVQLQFELFVDVLYYCQEPAPINAVITGIRESLKNINEIRTNVNPIKIPSESTLYRALKELDTYTKIRSQKGTRAAQKSQRHSRKQQPPYYLLERVECDNWMVHLEIVDRNGDPIGRPWLTVIIEIKTRCIIGWDLSMNAPSVEKTLRAIKHSLDSNNPHGGLSLLYILDNGPEFAEELSNHLYQLGSEPLYCEPGNGNQKPHIERFFKTYGVSIVQHMKGTTHSNISQKGDYDPEANATYTLEQLKNSFSDWLINCYHSHEHRALHCSPQEAWDQEVGKGLPPKKYSQEDLNRYFLSSVMVTPSNGRVRTKCLQWHGPGVAYLATLNDRPNRLILYYDPSELGTAWVTHPDHRDLVFTVDAVDPDYQVGLTMHMHNLIRKEFASTRTTFSYQEAKINQLRILLELSRENSKKNRKAKARADEAIANISFFKQAAFTSNITHRLQQHRSVPASPDSVFIHEKTPSTYQAVELNDGSRNHDDTE